MIGERKSDQLSTTSPCRLHSLSDLVDNIITAYIVCPALRLVIVASSGALIFLFPVHYFQTRSLITFMLVMTGYIVQGFKVR